MNFAANLRRAHDHRLRRGVLPQFQASRTSLPAATVLLEEGFGAHSTINVIRNPHNEGPYITA